MKKILVVLFRLIAVVCLFVVFGSVGAFERSMIGGSQLLVQICGAVMIGLLFAGFAEMMEGCDDICE